VRLATDPPRSWDDVFHPPPIRDIGPSGVGTMADDFAVLTKMPWNHPAMPDQWWNWWICWDKIEAEVRAR
jgi:hypothetical protein